MENLVLGIIFTVFAVIMLIIGALKKQLNCRMPMNM